MLKLPSFKEIQFQWLGNLYEDHSLSDNAVRVASYIALKYINKASGSAWPSYATLSKALGKSIKTIQRAIHELEKANWFTIKHGNGLKHNTEYTPSQSSILTAFEVKQKAAKSVTLSNKNKPIRQSNLSDKGGQICPPNLKNINNITSPLPPIASNTEPTNNEKDEGYNFSDLWNKWPQAMLPNSKDITERLFATLSFENQKKAIHYAQDFCRNIKLRKEPCLLIPYLKNKLFLEYDNAPPIDLNGYFKITPNLTEWSKWVRYIQKLYGDKALKNIIQLGYYLTKTKIPT